MIYTLAGLIPDAHNATPRGKKWVRAMHLPFHGGLIDRIYDAWQVFTQKAVAVRWPQAGELEDVFNIRNELLPEQITPADVVKILHKLGRHKNGTVHIECWNCFMEQYAEYRADCIKLLTEFSPPDVTSFSEYMDKYNLDETIPLSERIWTMHEHPLYQVGDYMGYNHHEGGHETEGFKKLTEIYDRTHPYPPLSFDTPTELDEGQQRMTDAANELLKFVEF